MPLETIQLMHSNKLMEKNFTPHQRKVGAEVEELPKLSRTASTPNRQVAPTASRPVLKLYAVTFFFFLFLELPLFAYFFF